MRDHLKIQGERHVRILISDLHIARAYIHVHLVAQTCIPVMLSGEQCHGKTALDSLPDNRVWKTGDNSGISDECCPQFYPDTSRTREVNWD